LTKFPAALVPLFPGLTYRDAKSVSPTETFAPKEGEGLGSAYREADETASVSQRDPFDVDPALVERGIKGHAHTQNALAQWIQGLKLVPRSPKASEPNYDVAWTAGKTIFVAEVKSLTKQNEEKQLRLGVGQVLRYCHLSRAPGVKIQPVLAVERKPTDDSWADLCSDLGILLVWPGEFDRLKSLLK
jgi:hypothetical protein